MKARWGEIKRFNIENIEYKNSLLGKYNNVFIVNTKVKYSTISSIEKFYITINKENSNLKINEYIIEVVIAEKI